MDLLLSCKRYYEKVNLLRTLYFYYWGTLKMGIATCTRNGDTPRHILKNFPLLNDVYKIRFH